jgi:predicted DCC family thiol-disulfide oxidoreductase YuxK
MKQLTVLYDPNCGLCRRLQAWAGEQPKYVELRFIPVNSQAAWHHYPELNHARTTTDLTVISDRGAVYWGPKAWLMCLWSLRQYRGWSMKLSRPELLPGVRRVVSAISSNRQHLGGAGKFLLRQQ